MREIRRLKPGAWIIGPSYSGFNATWIAQFLDQTKADGTIPEFVNWHFSGDVIGDANTVNGMLASRGITGVRLSINEYIFAQQQNSGYTAWYLAQLSKSAIQKAAHAIWTSCCMDGSLDQTLVNSGGSMQPTGQWWVYRRYADLSGTAIVTSGSGGVDLAAATDSGLRKATILLGSNNGFTGTVTVNLTGLGSTPYLMSNNQTQVVVERIPDTGSPLSAPLVIQSNLVSVTNGQATVTIPWEFGLDAYAITLALPGSLLPTPTLAPTPQNGQYEAENGIWGGGAAFMTDHTGYTGTGFIAGLIAQGAYSAFNVTVPASGNYPVTLRYSAGPNGPATNRTMHIYVNGSLITQTVMSRTVDWNTWATIVEILPLTAGSNSIQYQFDMGDTGYINTDNIVVGAILTGGATNTPTLVLQPPTSTPAGGGTISTTTWYSITNAGNDLCVDDAGGGTTNNTHVQQWACQTGNHNQWWQFQPTSNGYYRVVSFNNTSMEWDVTNTSTANGALIHLWGDYGGASQQWQPQALDNTHWKFVNLNSGSCLDVPGGSTTNGTQLDQWTCQGGNLNQSYTLTVANISTTAWYNVVNAGNGLCVDDAGGGTTNDTHVQQWACQTGNHNQWWQFQPTSNGYYRVVSFNNTSMEWDVTNTSTANGALIHLWGDYGGASQQWQPQAFDNTHWKFVNLNGGSCLYVPGGSTTNGTQLDQWTCQGGNLNQSYTLIPVG